MVVDLTQSNQLAAMARRGRLGPGDAGPAVPSAEGDDLAGTSPGARRSRSCSPRQLARSPGASAECVAGGAPAAESPDSRREQAHDGRRSGSAPAHARGRIPTAAGAADRGRARSAGRPAATDPPLAEAGRSVPPPAGGVEAYGPPPRLGGRGGLRALYEALRGDDGPARPGAPADPSDDLDQELIEGKSVLDQMRRSVPPLESCLPLYMQLERQQAREAHATVNKVKLLKHATYPMDLHLFQMATTKYREKHLTYSSRATEEHAAYVLRLSQHWATRSCTTLLKYDQAVREHVYLNTLSFAAATESQEQWLRIVMPEVIRAATRPQTGGGRSGQHREGIVDACGYFLNGGCPHVRSQQLLEPRNRSLCPYGGHECDTCSGSSDYDITCRRCHAEQHPRRRPGPQQQQQPQRPQGPPPPGGGSFQLRSTAPPYSGGSSSYQHGTWPQAPPMRQQQQQQQHFQGDEAYVRNVRQRQGGRGGRAPT